MNEVPNGLLIELLKYPKNLGTDSAPNLCDWCVLEEIVVWVKSSKVRNGRQVIQKVRPRKGKQRRLQTLAVTLKLIFWKTGRYIPVYFHDLKILGKKGM